MFDESIFDQRINELIISGHEKQAEDELLRAYDEIRSLGKTEQLEHVLNRLAQYYSGPNTEDLDKAERYFIECEALSPLLYPRLQTATFYFYIRRDFSKTVIKVDEIGQLRKAIDSPSYYSALTLKGQALIKLGRVNEAKEVLSEILTILNSNSPTLPYGDELNFLENAISSQLLTDRAYEVLDLILPRIRSRDYLERAQALLAKRGTT